MSNTSTVSTTVASPADAAPARRDALPSAWLREPLLHFLVLGGLLFAADAFLVGRAADPRSILVTTEVDSDTRNLFRSARGREPNPDELKALRERWIDNEVLYREGLALRVDQGDTAIRERVIFKSLSLLEAGLKLPPVNDTVLRQWFEARRAKYDEPARYDFQEAVLADDTSDAAVRTFVAALNAGTPGDAKAGLRVFKGRPIDSLVQTYGAQFVAALDAAPAGEWRAQPSKDGVRAIRVESIKPPRSADFDVLRGVVMQDWTDATMAEQRTAAVRNLAKKYAIKVEAEPR
jgi:hypothetical protein